MSDDWKDTVKKAADLFSSTLRGVDLIGNIAQGKLETHKGDEVLAALRLIANIADAIKKGVGATIPAEALSAYIDEQEESLRKSLAQIDADTKAAIDKKFPPAE